MTTWWVTNTTVFNFKTFEGIKKGVKTGRGEVRDDEPT